MSSAGLPERWRRPRPHHYLTYGAARAFLALVDLLPVSAVFALARGVGAVLWALDGKHRRIAERNLRQALLAASDAEIARLVRASFRFIAESGAEGLLLPRLAREGADAARARFTMEGAERLEALRGTRRGRLFVSGHLGSFDFLGAASGLFGFPFHTVSRPLKNPLLARFVARGREAWGQFLVPKRGALKWLLPILRRGGNAAFLLDQNERKRPLFLPVFGRLAACDRSVAALAHRLELPVVLGYAVRTGPGLRYHVVVDEVLHPREFDSDADLARRIQAVLERMILRHPDRYFWLHDRYRTRPPEERSAPSPAAPPTAAATVEGARS